MGGSQVTKQHNLSAADKRFFYYVANFPQGREACEMAGLPPVSEDVHDREMEAAFDIVTWLGAQEGLMQLVITASHWHLDLLNAITPMPDDEDHYEDFASISSRYGLGMLGLMCRKGLLK